MKKREQGIIKPVNKEINEEKLYNFNFVKFFEKSDLDLQSELSQKSIITSSSVPKKPECLLEEEKWEKVMKFLRTNPNLLLKLVPTTLAVDEQGVEKIQRQNFKLNKDLVGFEKHLKIKSSKGKRKITRSK